MFAIFLLATSTHATEVQRVWPFWDGTESIKQYSQRANLSVTKTLDLGNGVNLEVVLIPAGKFIMGTPEPKPVNEDGFRSKILTSQVILGIGTGTFLILLTGVLIRAIRKRQRPQYSLACFLAITVAASIGLLGGLQWQYSVKLLRNSRNEYEAAMARYKSSFDWEKPAREVTISKPYYIGKTEVTQEQYHVIMGDNPSKFTGCELPVETVSLSAARVFCTKVGAQTREVVRLPSEAEWEYACRAGTRTNFFSGDQASDLDRAGWYESNSKRAPHPVAQKEPNAWGVYDMHGNMHECCCEAYWDGNFSIVEVDAMARGNSPQGNCLVLRGGSWKSDPWFCRSACRYFSPVGRVVGFGFRVVVVPPVKAQRDSEQTK